MQFHFAHLPSIATDFIRLNKKASPVVQGCLFCLILQFEDDAALNYCAPPTAGTHQLSGAEISTPPISVRMRMRRRPAFLLGLSSAVTRY
jgi:hypothetical protein